MSFIRKTAPNVVNRNVFLEQLLTLGSALCIHFIMWLSAVAPAEVRQGVL